MVCRTTREPIRYSITMLSAKSRLRRPGRAGEKPPSGSAATWSTGSPAGPRPSRRRRPPVRRRWPPPSPRRTAGRCRHWWASIRAGPASSMNRARAPGRLSGCASSAALKASTWSNGMKCYSLSRSRNRPRSEISLTAALPAFDMPVKYVKRPMPRSPSPPYSARWPTRYASPSSSGCFARASARPARSPSPSRSASPPSRKHLRVLEEAGPHRTAGRAPVAGVPYPPRGHPRGRRLDDEVSGLLGRLFRPPRCAACPPDRRPRTKEKGRG